jgi:hypothetical protein
VESKVISLVPAAAQAKEDYCAAAVEVAEALLVATKATGITAVLAVTIDSDSTLRMWQGGENNTTELLGAIEALKMHFYHANT